MTFLISPRLNQVVCDVLRIRQILTNLISNAIKFTHEGKVGINLYVVPEQISGSTDWHQSTNSSQEEIGENSSILRNSCKQSGDHLDICSSLENGERITTTMASLMDEDTGTHCNLHETTVWLRCDVYDTGIGIPEKALPTLFKKYMQVSADHARKYGGTGLGLAICKQLVELMGGHLTVTSQEKHGSTFTFVLPCKVSPRRDGYDDSEEAGVSESMSDDNAEFASDAYFSFQPRTLGSIFSGAGSTSRTKQPSTSTNGHMSLSKLDGLQDITCLLPSNLDTPRESISINSAYSISDAAESSSEHECYAKRSANVDVTSNGRGKSHRINTNGLVMNRYQGPTLGASNAHSVASFQNGPKTSEEKDDLVVKSTAEESTSQSKDYHGSDQTSQCSLKPAKAISQPKILLVEDNKINIMVTQSMMKQIGHAIDVVNNGLEAVHAVQHYNYDLILMDVCMPVMDGLQATRLIRSFEENGNWDAVMEAGIKIDGTFTDSQPSNQDTSTLRRRIPIIAMTANALAESAAECLANGMDSFVSKPVTFQKLKQCLQQYLQQ